MSSPIDESRMPLTEHLDELRKRLIRSLLAYIVGVGISYNWSREIFNLLKRPLAGILANHSNSSFAMRSISEGFMVEIKVAMIAGVFVASPMIFYQIWKFVAPGLYAHERRIALPAVSAATILFIVGASFGYFIIFPTVASFLISFTTEDTAALLSIDEYLDFTARLLGGFGLVFELPLVIFILSWLGIVNYKQLQQIRRYVIVANFAISAVITPPDVLFMLMVAFPLVLLYEVGIVVSWLTGRQRKTDAEVSGQQMSTDLIEDPALRRSH